MANFKYLHSILRKLYVTDTRSDVNQSMTYLLRYFLLQFCETLVRIVCVLKF